MKLAILGTGMIVKDFLTIKDQLSFEKVYILGSEATCEETEELKEKYGLDKTYYDYDEMLSSDADTVYVALPNFLHYSFARKALEAGKHVILEKPGTSNEREFQELKEIAEEKGRILLEAMTVHYMPAYVSLKKELDKLGDLKIVSLNYSQYSSRYDRFKNGEVLPVFDPAKAGGALMDLNVYNVHFAVGLFGRPASVQYYANVERGIDTSGILLMDYGQFKVVSVGAKDCKAPVICSLQGDKACLEIKRPVNGMTSYEVDYNNGEKETYEDEHAAHRMLHEFKAFIHIVDEKDMEAAEKMLKISLDVSYVLTTARKSAGIIFPMDEQGV